MSVINYYCNFIAALLYLSLNCFRWRSYYYYDLFFVKKFIVFCRGDN